MTKASPRTERRAEALTKEQIVEAAVAILDQQGASALTFRALAARLATGSGAIYWYVANKDDLLAAATDHIVARAIRTASAAAEPRDAIRNIALAIFDALELHPWVGAQLSFDPERAAILKIFEAIGAQLEPLGVPDHARFNAWSALVNYILGVAEQNAENARRSHPEGDREASLQKLAARWKQLDAAEYPFLRKVAEQLPGHDDREQFLAGIDLILTGISAIR